MAECAGAAVDYGYVCGASVSFADGDVGELGAAGAHCSLGRGEASPCYPVPYLRDDMHVVLG